MSIDTKETLGAELNKIAAWCSEHKTPATNLPLHLDPGNVLPWYAERMEELRGEYDGLKFAMTKRYFQTVTDSLASLQASSIEYDAAIEREDLSAARSILESVCKVCQTVTEAIDRLRQAGL